MASDERGELFRQIATKRLLVMQRQAQSPLPPLSCDFNFDGLFVLEHFSIERKTDASHGAPGMNEL